MNHVGTHPTSEGCFTGEIENFDLMGFDKLLTKRQRGSNPRSNPEMLIEPSRVIGHWYDAMHSLLKDEVLLYTHSDRGRGISTPTLSRGVSALRLQARHRLGKILGQVAALLRA